MSHGEAKTLLDRLAALNGNLSALAREQGIPRPTMQGRVQAAQRAIGRGAGAPEPVRLDPRSELALRDRIKSLESDLRAAHREENQWETLREAVVGAAATPLSKPKWERLRGKSGHEYGLPLLLVSDVHINETVSRAELGGLNEYSPEIFLERYNRLIEKTIALLTVHQPADVRWPGIIYARGGDMIEAGIHEELARNMTLQSMPALRDLVDAEAAGIRRLLEVFPRVHVPTVPGNHGRLTKKPQASNAVDMNYDTLAGWMLERVFAGDARVTFDAPQTGECMLDVPGDRKALLVHGDKMGVKGGDGHVGALGPIRRGAMRMFAGYRAAAKPIDYLLMGHWHQSLDLGNTFVNGSMIGYNGFAKMMQYEPPPAEQTLLVFHPTYGVSQRWRIVLSEVGK